MADFNYIENPKDSELTLAWKLLRKRVGNLDGWQYRGSGRNSEGWMHSFRNRRLMDEASNEEEYEAAIQEVPASVGWPASQG